MTTLMCADLAQDRPMTSCDNCGGEGGFKSWEWGLTDGGGWVDCPACNGSGWVEGEGERIDQDELPPPRDEACCCPSCHGEALGCHDCSGTGNWFVYASNQHVERGR